MGKQQRDKGKRGERAWRDELRAAGFDPETTYRTNQFSGKCPDGSPDVHCGELPDLHFEVKNVEKLNVWAAMDRALDDTPFGKLAVVAHTKSNQGFLVTMTSEAFFDIVRESTFVKPMKKNKENDH